MELLPQEQAREGWAALNRRRQGQRGYRWVEERLESLRTRPASGPGVYTVPMRVQQAQVVGVLGVLDTPENPLTDDERVLLAALAEQVAVALDRARLFEDTRRNAAREQVVGELSARMRESMDIDAVLQTTVREILGTLDFASVEVRLGNSPVRTGSTDAAERAFPEKGVRGDFNAVR